MTEILLDNHQTLAHIQEQILPLTTFFAQAVRDPKVLDQMQVAFKNFVQSGQAWALGIGLILGYMLRSMTSF